MVQLVYELEWWVSSSHWEEERLEAPLGSNVGVRSLSRLACCSTIRRY